MTEGRGTSRLDLKAFDAAIFDLDGVVTDTARVHAMAWKRLFDEYLQARSERTGEPFRPFDAHEDYLRYLDGRPRYDGVRSFLQVRGIILPEGSADDPPDRETIRGLGNQKNAYFLTALEEGGVAPYPSTVDLVRRLRKAGVRTAIISASRNCADVLRKAGLEGLFDTRVDGVTSDELGLAGKPDPAIFLEASRRLGVSPARAFVVEDAQAGVEAGRRGGFGLVIGVDRVGQAEALRQHGADVVVRDLSEIEAFRSRAPRPISDVPLADQHRKEVAGRLRDKRPAVFLDYDGTLTPIVNDPAQALLPPETKRVLQELARRCVVAVISGRDLQDVRSMVAIEGIAYSGSHGFDILLPDGRRDQTRGEQFLPDLDRAEALLTGAMEDLPGARVERKRFAIAVHYRLMDDRHIPELERRVEALAERTPALRRTGGKRVFELRPNVEWDKGTALLSLLRTLDLDEERTTPLFIGDDETDEDAFRSLHGVGISIVVGEGDRETLADYALRDPDEVRDFLTGLVSLLNGGAG